MSFEDLSCLLNYDYGNFDVFEKMVILRAARCRHSNNVYVLKKGFHRLCIDTFSQFPIRLKLLNAFALLEDLVRLEASHDEVVDSPFVFEADLVEEIIAVHHHSDG